MTDKEITKLQLKFTIESLNKLNSILQSKYQIITDMQKERIGQMKFGHLQSKKSGLKLAKEEIRRELKELELELNKLL